MLSIDDVQTIGVCGAGTMGAGIAQVAAMAGFRALLYDVQPANLEKAEAEGRGDYSPLWVGSGAARVQAIPAEELTRRLAAAALKDLHR